MKILYITDGGPGGVSSHVRCLTQCLKDVAEVMVCITQKTEFLQEMLDEDGTPYHLCNCSSGHDLRLFFEIRHVVKTFKPDVIHLHDIRLFGTLYLRFFTKIPRVCSIHLPSNPDPDFSRRVVNWLVQPCYWLPVSKNNWERFSAYHPGVRGEVFYNSMQIDIGRRFSRGNGRRGFVVGMVGRNAAVKDWPAFCSVAQIERSNNRTITFWGIGVSAEEAVSYGEEAKCVEWKGLQPNGREWIGKMDVLLLTSVSEEMPTVVLEAFQTRTPICGFIPKGGMSDLLDLSNGPLREVFIQERDCRKLAKIVEKLRRDSKLRQMVAEDGWQILVNYFDAEKNCRGQLMNIYWRECGRARDHDL